MNRFEARIRDYLADNLSVIEGDLLLVKKEFELANAVGAGGKIDILTKDRFGHFVVIEIKRSDQTARAALHELTKYVALLKSSLGIRPEQIRALLVSTEWHELAVPFSEYQKVCEVPTEGIVITAESDGIVTAARAYIAPVVEQPVNISRSQHVVLFVKEEARDRSVAQVVEAAKNAKLSDFAIFSANYEGANSSVIYPYGVYIVFSSPLDGLNSKEATKIKRSIAWDGELDEPDENFLIALLNSLESVGDTSEVGSPERLSALAAQQWRVTVVHRNGRYAANALLLSDAVLIAEAKKTQGGAAHYIECTASPRYLPSWKKLKKDSKLVLLGNLAWSKTFEAIIAHVERTQRSATVSTHLYYLGDIVFGLAKLCSSGDTRYLPSMQLVVTDVDETVLYVGTVAWNGRPVSLSSEDWIKKAYGSIEENCLMRQFGEQWTKDDEACRLLGLQNVVLEICNPGTKVEKIHTVTKSRIGLNRVLVSESAHHSMLEFCQRNRTFASSLLASLASFTTGLVD